LKTSVSIEDQQALAVTTLFEGDGLELLFEVMRAGGFATPSSAIKHAVWMLARHLDLDAPVTVFDLKQGGQRVATSEAIPAGRERAPAVVPPPGASGHARGGAARGGGRASVGTAVPPLRRGQDPQSPRR
jgi:hypothetical protein